MVSYLIIAIAVAIGLPLLVELPAIQETGSGNAQALAGAISEALTTAILRLIVDIPILGLFLWYLTRRGENKSEE